MDQQEVLLEIHGDVREMGANMKHLVDHVKRLEDAQDKHEERIDVLEREKIRLYSYAAGIGTVGATGAVAALDWLKAHFHMLAIILAFLLSSCAAAGPHGAEAYWHDFQRPVEVYVHADMSEECVEATIAALDFWRDQGVDYLRPRSVGDAWYGWTVPGAGPTGTISVRQNTIAIGQLGVTYSRHINSRQRAARVRLAVDSPSSCTLAVAAHELGHALGLSDRYDTEDRDTLMYYASSNSLKLDADELSWVR